MPEYTLVDRPSSINADLSSHDVLGVDTEFMREKTYFAQLCLVQISTRDRYYCVDPLVDEDLNAFWQELMDKTWVVHSARQDIEVILQTAALTPRCIFDTQIAAGLLGHMPQLSYAGLVKELFQVELAKSHTRADWTRRPLSDAVLQYAAEDVEYLLPAFDVLAELLDKKGRLAWAEEDSSFLLNPALYDTDPNLAIARLKGARNMQGRPRNAAARLAAWRENEALRANRPRQWIVKDITLLDLATTLPANMDDLAKVKGLSPKLLRRAGDDILDAIRESANDKSDYQPPIRPNETHKALLKEMQALVADCAADLGLTAEIVAPKKELSAIITNGDRESRVFSGWRRKLVGEQLIELL
jgi:ribonuclease D